MSETYWDDLQRDFRQRYQRACDFVNSGATISNGVLAPSPVEKLAASYGGSRLWSLLMLEPWIRVNA